MELTEEKQRVLTRVNELINKKKDELYKEIPSIHEIDDGIIIRFFANWDNCEDDNSIKYKRIVNHDDPDESVVFFFIPKGARFQLGQRYYIGCMTCLNGAISITANNETRVLENYSKFCINSADVDGIAFENTYLVVTSKYGEWSDNAKERYNIN